MNVAEALSAAGFRVREATPGPRGWWQVPCPLCGDEDAHLGFREGGRWHCWKCGWHPGSVILRALHGPDWLLRVPADVRAVLLPSVRAAPGPERTVAPEPEREAVFPQSHDTPSAVHEGYLRGRGFSHRQLELLWGIRYTTNVYTELRPAAWRVLAPIRYGDLSVSWTARAVSPGVLPVWYTSPPELETRPAKSCLYGADRATRPWCVVVEGPGDVWRLGDGAVATLGTEWTTAQARLLARLWRKVYMMFDFHEDAAQQSAKRLAAEVSALGTSAEVVWLQTPAKDPGELSVTDAWMVMEELRHAANC